MLKKIRHLLFYLFLSLALSFTPVYAKDLKPNVKSSIAMIVHQETGEIIYQKNAYKTASIASLTKIMTAMVMLDSGINLDEEV